MVNKCINIIMVGPDRREKGGIASVVNQYFEAGIDKRINIQYIGTAISGRKILKFLFFIKSLAIFIVRVKSYDIVHVNMASRGSYRRKKYFIRIAKFLKKKVIIHLHGGEFHIFYERECSSKQKDEIENIFKIADQIIALSEEWEEFLSKICDRTKITVLYNSIKIPNFIKADYENKNILFLGRLEEKKGIYDLIDSASDIVEKYPDAIFHFGGNGDSEKIKAICKQRAIEDNMNFLGWVTGEVKEDYLKACSIFVLPSYNEGMPISLLEAMAYGCAVISTNVGGIPKVINDKKNGLLHEPGDKIALKNCLEELLSNEDNKKMYGQTAYTTVLKNFNIEKNLEILYGIYERLEN